MSISIIRNKPDRDSPISLVVARSLIVIKTNWAAKRSVGGCISGLRQMQIKNRRGAAPGSLTEVTARSGGWGDTRGVTRKRNAGLHVPNLDPIFG